MLINFYLFIFNSPVQAANKKQVVLYTALDQIFSETIIQDFEQETGIRVKVVYDTEAAKTTGLVNRLIAEKDNPNADVFWNNEIARSVLLKDKGILAAYKSAQAKDIPSQFKDRDGFWTGFAARARVLIYNKDMVKADDLPKSIFDLTDVRWSGNFCLANPLFGTTATHCAALFVALGDEKAKAYFQALADNQVVMVSGNSVSRDRVVEGELALGFTDTDDAWVAITEGKNVNMIYPDNGGLGTLLIPNTVCLIKNAPHPDEAKQLIDYILSKQVEEKLAFSSSMQIPLRKGIKKPSHVPDYDALSVMDIDFEAVAHKLNQSGEFLTGLFLK
ncbi:MAG: extracellular solute-binding protein [Candidatus Omnitrophica bacterium]|nr:extracellular solute-binding protein [Candidatus Omnitrophota bacterium]